MPGGHGDDYVLQADYRGLWRIKSGLKFAEGRPYSQREVEDY